ncbi:hypothetical protein [Capnocytophaga haemolytica]|uniref:hypothetical protein n=1 Tax=Capnocytophaga haemolytica TaxID=45243 RepID=UPI000A6D4C1B|nr:hypothetical protein [Capnocytophaga haemolytica]
MKTRKWVILGQQRLPPTVVSIYNYAQPVVAIVVSLVMGIGVFGLRQAFATALVFVGVWFVMSNE